MLAGKPLPLYGDGRTRRDYTYVDDVVAGIRAAMTYRDSMFEVVNLGNNRTVSLRELVDALAAVTGTNPALQFLPEQPGDVPQTWARIEKAQRLLGYTPETSLVDGLERFVSWLASVQLPAHITPAVSPERRTVSPHVLDHTAPASVRLAG
jgi:UDP-glucuronate 4-epimerase